jgi:TrmH family RNA methyltransferase
MISNAELKLLNQLSLKKYRFQLKLFTAENTKIVQELSEQGIYPEHLFITEQFFKEHPNLIRTVASEEILDSQLAKVSQLSQPAGLVAVYKYFEFPILKDQKINIYLDNIRDPGNLGAILRIADWYGLKQIFASEKGTVELYNMKTMHASMGSLGRVGVHYMELEDVIKQINPDQVFNTTLESDATSVWTVNTSSNDLIILGSESHGVDDHLLNNKGFKSITIPQFGKVESLNVAYATSVILDNFKRLEVF